MRLDRRFVLAGILALTPLLAPAGADAEQETLRVGIMSAEDEDVWAVVAEQAKTKASTSEARRVQRLHPA
jgi:D-methionine transport system substrate-binding protein